MWRKLGAVAKPNVIIGVDGEKWSIKSETTFTTSEMMFELNKEFEETTPDGRKVQVSVSRCVLYFMAVKSLSVIVCRNLMEYMLVLVAQ